MHDVLEVSYTGDLLAHRRCPRSWALEKYAGFYPHEQVQAMEGRLVHHAMEWLARRFRETKRHASADELHVQLSHFFRVLWGRGVRTAFASKEETLRRVRNNLYPSGRLDRTVRIAIEGAVHTEYELRTVRKLVKADFAGIDKLMLTGILDLVIQQEQPLTYSRTWTWNDEVALTGGVRRLSTPAAPRDVEIWDYKGTRATSPYIRDFVLQLLTYAGLYAERTGTLPARCVLFFVNEPVRQKKLVAIRISAQIVTQAEAWTIRQAKHLRETMLGFERDPLGVEGGDLEKQHKPRKQRVDPELKKQCTACSHRFTCATYREHLGQDNHPDIRLNNVRKA